MMKYDSIHSGKHIMVRIRTKWRPCLGIKVIHMTTPEERKDFPADDGKDKTALRALKRSA